MESAFIKLVYPIQLVFEILFARSTDRVRMLIEKNNFDA